MRGLQATMRADANEWPCGARVVGRPAGTRTRKGFRPGDFKSPAFVRQTRNKWPPPGARQRCFAVDQPESVRVVARPRTDTLTANVGRYRAATADFIAEIDEALDRMCLTPATMLELLRQ